MNAPTSPKIGKPAYSPVSYLSERKPDLEVGDIITAVDGETLPVDSRFGEVIGSELTSRLQAKWETPVTVSVERPAAKAGDPPKKFELELPAVPVKTLGLGFAVGPITAIQTGSQAEKAGLKVGDKLIKIDGEEIDNALRIPTRIGQLAGKEVKLTVERPLASSGSTAEFETVELNISGPTRPTFDPISDLSGELTLGGMGAALTVLPSIISVNDEQLESAGALKAGDELLQIQWLANAKRKEELADFFKPQVYEAIVVDSSFNIASLYDIMQNLPAGSEIKCWVRRDGKTVDAIAKLEYAKDWFWHERGIGISPLMHIHKTDSVATALNLGVWETSRRFGDVLGFLRLLVTGKIGAKGVGGPIAIAEAASSEASFGVSRLMIFLTLLSANLAILNFLPIPALDGGHMVFLTAEAIRGKPVSEALQTRLTMAGVLGLLSLMAFVIVKDIMRLMS